MGDEGLISEDEALVHFGGNILLVYDSDRIKYEFGNLKDKKRLPEGSLLV